MNNSSKNKIEKIRKADIVFSKATIKTNLRRSKMFFHWEAYYLHSWHLTFLSQDNSVNRTEVKNWQHNYLEVTNKQNMQEYTFFA